jgi:hypothetical protein
MSWHEKFNVVHFAITNQCACGQAIHGGTTRISDPAYSNPSGYSYDYEGDPNIQHTTIKAEVTCSQCKASATYKNYLDD